MRLHDVMFAISAQGMVKAYEDDLLTAASVQELLDVEGMLVGIAFACSEQATLSICIAATPHHSQH
jgi:hypothetical protein